MARGKELALREGGEDMTIELPAYAVRYLVQMCKRERATLTNLSSTGVYSIALNAAFDALTQIEAALPEERHCLSLCNPQPTAADAAANSANNVFPLLRPASA